MYIPRDTPKLTYLVYNEIVELDKKRMIKVIRKSLLCICLLWCQVFHFCVPQYRSLLGFLGFQVSIFVFHSIVANWVFCGKAVLKWECVFSSLFHQKLEFSCGNLTNMVNPTKYRSSCIKCTSFHCPLCALDVLCIRSCLWVYEIETFNR